MPGSFFRFITFGVCFAVAGFVAGYAYTVYFRSHDYTGESLAVSNDPELKVFINSYFSAWNRQDWDAYKAKFHPRAVIYSNRKSALIRSERDRFVAGQKNAVEASKLPLREVAENMFSERKGKSASAVVYWKLFRGTKIRRGVNRFSLTYNEELGNWQIVSLYWR